MAYDVKHNQKKMARELRRRGFSYLEIHKEISVPKSTLSLWLKRIKLSDEQKMRLQEKRKSVARSNATRRSEKYDADNLLLIRNSQSQVGILSSRELWLLGIALYWKSSLRSNITHDLGKGFRFAASDPLVIKLILRWLLEVGRIKKEELILSVYDKSTLKSNPSESTEYWRKITEFPQSAVIRYYNSRVKSKATSQRKRDMCKHGVLQIKVRGSSKLARQIAGWTTGIHKNL